MIVNEHMTIYPLNDGDHDVEIPYFMYKYTGRRINKYNLEIWENVVSEIFYGRPFVTGWINGQTAEGHMMVLCGIEYDGSDVNNDSYHSIALMEPNAPKYVVVQYYGWLYLGYDKYIMTTSYR